MSLALISLGACDKDGIVDPKPNCNGLDVANPAVFEKILDHLLTNEAVVEGDWQGDFGDATGYAPPVLLAHGKAACDETAIALAHDTIEREYKLIHAFLNNASEALIGGLGLTEVYETSEDKRAAEEARYLSEIVDAAYEFFNENGLLPKSMTDIYGQTASTAIIAALQLQYVIKVDPVDIKRRNRALEIVDKIAAAAYNSAGFYIYEAGNTELYLYPNVAMMLVHSLAYHASKDAHHLEIARSLLAAIEPLFLTAIDAYRSRARGGYDYVTLSSHNYLALALISLYNETGDAIYLNKARRTIDFILKRLYSEGIVYHDLTNNQRSSAYCTGCNFQFLFILWKMADTRAEATPEGFIALKKFS